MMSRSTGLIQRFSIAAMLAVEATFAGEASPQLSVGPEHRIGVRLGDQVVLESPPEGLWSVATDWTNGWPAGWVHAQPSKIWREGEWTRMTGQVKLPEGHLELLDSYRTEGEVLRGVRRFTWHGKSELPRCTLSVRWLAPGATNAKPLLPGIVYYGNPSGARTGAGAVAVHAGLPGDTSLFEEHRYAAPFACVEWLAGESFRSAALHTVPSLVAGGHHADQWWSLGVIAQPADTELTLLSGPCAANGQRSVVKALQQKFLPYPDAWMSLRPGAVVEKTFFLQVCPRVEQGSGFRTPLRTALLLHPPFNLDSLPAFEEIIHDKYRFAVSRFRDRATDPGFEMYPDSVKGTHYVMGWCGQAEALGGALLRLAPRLGDPEAVNRAVRAMNHLATAPFNEQGFLLKYTAESGQWSDQDHVSQGQAMEGFARAILAARARGGIVTISWEVFLRKACALHAERILRDDWRPISTAEAFYVSPLCKASRLFDNPDFRRAAVKAAEHYARRHLDMREPYWGGTLDARCEDKEGALAGFQAFLAVYELTRETRYLEWAAHALDVALTYTVLWDIDLPAGRLRDHDLKTRGWTIVSAQNQHLDVYAVLFTPEIWRMGEYLGRDDLKRLAAVMYRSCGQLIDPQGSQGEQIQHTNFGQAGELADVFRLRGGYSEGWTVFWITAHFLNAAAQFDAMGVDLDRVDTFTAKAAPSAGRALESLPDEPKVKVLKLWEGQTKPYYKENTLVEREEKVWGTLCITNVTEPTLTIYPAKTNNAGVGVVILPGGNYSVVAIHHEGYDVAKALSDRGIVAAVLKYRLPDPKSSNQPEHVPLADTRRALKLLRQQAATYGIQQNKVGVLGFSAGSHLATMTSLWKSGDADENPAFSGLIYGVTNDSAENLKWLEENLYFRKLTPAEQARNRLLDLVDKTTPPAFLIHAGDDDTCKVEESTLYAQKLFENQVPVEVHLFPKGGHGFGLGRKTDGTDQWLPLFVAWLLRQ